ncbi:short chain dehydrogenase domain-containing protein [Sarocladium implicatum]|nr:short chain dehydrogenase domain-containing protein [Sarocladium implicatum]
MAERKRTVFITGCSPGGIGNALAEEYLARGYHVLGTARNPAVLKDLVAKGLTALSLDVSKEDSIKACSDEVNRLTDGKLDILINNAGARDVCPLMDNTTTQIQYVYQTNVFGPMRLVQLLLPSLIATRGLIINISSASSRIPYLFGGVYSSSKAALDNWTSVLRMELKPFHVRVMLSVTGTVTSSNTKLEGDLPANSLYKTVEDVFHWRLGYSQNKKTMPREAFAKRLANAAERGEGWLGGLVGGVPYDFWAGGMTPLIWTATTFLPRWLCEWLTWRHFGVFSMARRIQAARAKRAE